MHVSNLSLRMCLAFPFELFPIGRRGDCQWIMSNLLASTHNAYCLSFPGDAYRHYYTYTNKEMVQLYSNNTPRAPSLRYISRITSSFFCDVKQQHDAIG